MARDCADLQGCRERLGSARRCPKSWELEWKNGAGNGVRPRGCQDLEGAQEDTHVQDIAATGQVAAVRQGRPAQVHATFGPTTSWPLAIRKETEVAELSPSPVVSRKQRGSPHRPIQPAGSSAPAPLAHTHPAGGGRRRRRRFPVEHQAVTRQRHPSRGPVLPGGQAVTVVENRCRITRWEHAHNPSSPPRSPVARAPPWWVRLSSPELAPPLGNFGHVEGARLFHFLGSGRGGDRISKPPHAAHRSRQAFPKASQE